MTTPAKRPPTDWEAIEREYRAGMLSLRELAAMHPVSRAAIQKRAKVKGWKRDLRKRVQQAIAAKLVASEVADADEAATVEMAAERGASIHRLHQRRAAKAQDTVEALMTKLATEDGLPLSALATAASNLSTAFKNLVAIERQAYGLSDDGSDKASGVTVEIVKFAEMPDE